MNNTGENGNGESGQPEEQPKHTSAQPTQEEKKKRKSGQSGKEAASDIPSWAEGELPFKGENANDFAKRLLDDKYARGIIQRGREVNSTRFANGGIALLKILKR